MRPEKQSLIHDVFEDKKRDTRRQDILVAGGQILRHRRRWRIATRCLSMAVITFLMALGIHRVRERIRETQAANLSARPAMKAAPLGPTQIHYISDEELLDLFPHTPVALATIGGKKRLIFPRPDDEARFVSRLPASAD